MEANTTTGTKPSFTLPFVDEKPDLHTLQVKEECVSPNYERSDPCLTSEQENLSVDVKETILDQTWTKYAKKSVQLFVPNMEAGQQELLLCKTETFNTGFEDVLGEPFSNYDNVKSETCGANDDRHIMAFYKSVNRVQIEGHENYSTHMAKGEDPLCITALRANLKMNSSNAYLTNDEETKSPEYGGDASQSLHNKTISSQSTDEDIHQDQTLSAQRLSDSTCWAIDCQQSPSRLPQIQLECMENQRYSLTDGGTELDNLAFKTNLSKTCTGLRYTRPLPVPGEIESHRWVETYIKSDSAATSFRTTNNTNTPLKLFTYDKGFKTAPNLNTPEKLPLALKPNIRSVRDKSFSNISSVNAHKNVHQEVKPFACDQCNKFFPSRSRLNTHRKIHLGVKPFACNVCGKGFVGRSVLKSHMNKHLGVKPFTCDVCNKSFVKKSVLTNHMTVHLGMKPYTCDMCNKRFAKLSTLKTHGNIHLAVKPYTCGVCHKSFASLSALDNHKHVHLDAKPYTCDVCNKSFKWRSNWINHKFTHLDTKPHTCDVCCRSFSAKTNLNKHKKIHTVVETHTCDVCCKSFKWKSYWLRHICGHVASIMKPYICDMCNRGFRSLNQLKVHLNVHLSVRMYKCDVCIIKVLGVNSVCKLTKMYIKQ